LPLVGCEKLEELWLSGNQPRRAVLAPIKSLKLLALDRNRLTKIDLSPLSGCKKLEKLFLSHNQLEHIDLSPLSSLKNLKSLTLQHNNLKKIDLSPVAHIRGLVIEADCHAKLYGANVELVMRNIFFRFCKYRVI